MLMDWLFFSGLWIATFFYADVISRFLEPLSVFLVMLSGLGYALNYWETKVKKSEVQHPHHSQWCALLVTGLGNLGHYFLLLFSLLLFRSFGFDVARVVSGSLKPTVLINDTIVVKKYQYGLRLPLTGHLILPVTTPKRGDIVSFRSPKEPSVTMIKRMIGLPGDHIQYHNKQLTINGVLVPQSTLYVEQDTDYTPPHYVLKKEEQLANRRHPFYISLEEPGDITDGIFTPFKADAALSFRVPSGQYFVMGDNRDNSWDSRHWGFVPARYLLGEVWGVLISWDKKASWKQPLAWVRWERVGKKLV